MKPFKVKVGISYEASFAPRVTKTKYYTVDVQARTERSANNKAIDVALDLASKEHRQYWVTSTEPISQ